MTLQEALDWAEGRMVSERVSHAVITTFSLLASKIRDQEEKIAELEAQLTALRAPVGEELERILTRLRCDSWRWNGPTGQYKSLRDEVVAIENAYRQERARRVELESSGRILGTDEIATKGEYASAKSRVLNAESSNAALRERLEAAEKLSDAARNHSCVMGSWQLKMAAAEYRAKWPKEGAK